MNGRDYHKQPEGFWFHNFLYIVHIGFAIFIYGQTSYFVTFLSITMWSFHLNTLYFILLLLTDIAFYCFKTNKFEKLNYFLRNTFAQVVNHLSFLVAFVFWCFIIIGAFLNTDTMGRRDIMNVRRYIQTFYTHGICAIQILVDIYYRKREETFFKKNCAIFATIISVSYQLMVIILKYCMKVNVYPFIGKIGAFGVAMNSITISVLEIECYKVYLKLIKSANNDISSSNKKKI